jgi:hypothetical protein
MKNKGAAAALPFSPRLAQRVRQRVRRLRPRMMWVNQREPQQSPIPPGAPGGGPKFVPDGFIYPRPEDFFFDVSIRMQSIGPGTGGNPNVIVQNVFTQADKLKGGWISAVGYEYNNPHGFFQVRTTLLINSATPANYQFRTVDSVAGTVDGSFPTVQIGTVDAPADVRIMLPSNGLVQIRASNASQSETFSLVVRLKGWSFGN